MPRPWFEGAAAIAAAGVPAPPPTPIHPIARKLRMSGSPRFAFIPAAPARGVAPRPVIQPDLAHLAACIERRRDGVAIQLQEVEDFELQDRAGIFTAVQIFTLDMANERDGLLGTAWLDGRGRDTLEPALRQAWISAQRKEAA